MQVYTHTHVHDEAYYFHYYYRCTSGRQTIANYCPLAMVMVGWNGVPSIDLLPNSQLLVLGICFCRHDDGAKNTTQKHDIIP